MTYNETGDSVIDGIAADRQSAILRQAGIDVWQESEAQKSIPKELQKLPCDELNAIAQTMRAMAAKHTHHAGIIGALGLAMTVSGRLYMSDFRNTSSLYMVAIDHTGRGKDLIKQGIKSFLLEAGFPGLLAGSNFTSVGAIRDSLRSNPTGVWMLDEWGDKLNHALHDKGGHVKAGFDSFKEIFSDSATSWLPMKYSERQMSDAEKEANNQPIYAPSPVIVGLTTPEQCVRAITGDMSEGGMLNRYIMADLTGEKVRSNRKLIDPEDIDPSLIRHIQKVRNIDHPLLNGRSYSDDSGFRPLRVRVGITSDAFDLKEEFEDEQARDDGTDFVREMRQRWTEVAMRMATGIAPWIDPSKPVMTADLLQWCFDYVKFHSDGFVTRMMDTKADSAFAAKKLSYLKRIRQSGSKGIGAKELCKKVPFSSDMYKQRMEIIADLEAGGQIRGIVQGENERGPTPKRFYALKGETLAD